ncbi:MAG: hypothetical protein JF606_29615 [Burkholderiales bacterium]|nr:hypothetical protein [Burkholderiales bacterium]
MKRADVKREDVERTHVQLAYVQLADVEGAKKKATYVIVPNYYPRPPGRDGSIPHTGVIG